MTNDATERVLAALEEVTRRPEYAHKVNWAVNDFIRSELKAYGRAWEQTAGPASERGGSPMEAGEEIVGDAEAALVEKITKAVLAAQAELQAAVAAAYEDAADCIEGFRGGIYHPEDVAVSIRARTPADALAALEAVKREARNEAAEAADVLGYHCIGCGHLCGDPDKDLRLLCKSGAKTCCPEREMEPLSAAILALMEDQSDD